MSSSTNKPTSAFWIISFAAFLWNISGVVAYLGQAYMTDEVLLALPEAEQNYYNNVPAWVTAAFAIAVFAGIFACVGLLMRKKWATTLFIISLIAVIVQFIYNFFMQTFVEVSGNKIIMPTAIIIIALFLAWFSIKSERKGWIS
ncbi:MAG TPA: hypothetical protein VIN72_03785 [Lutibacter sp.]